MIDVFVDLLQKLARDGIYRKAIDPSIAFSTFYSILADPHVVSQILARYFHVDEISTAKTPIFCLCEQLFGERRAAELVSRGPIASSKVSDLAERLHVAICIARPSQQQPESVKDHSGNSASNSSSLLAQLRRLVAELAGTLVLGEGSTRPDSQQALATLRHIEDTAAAITSHLQRPDPSAESPYAVGATKDADFLQKPGSSAAASDRALLLQKDEQIRALTGRVTELEAGLADMCARVEAYVQQMDAYSRTMAAKNDEILALHQQLKGARASAEKQELAALQGRFDDQGRELTQLRTDLAAATATVERLTQECIALNKATRQLPWYEALVGDALDTLSSLAGADADLSYAPPTRSEQENLPQYIRAVVGTLRTKARWLIGEASEHALPLPSKDVSPALGHPTAAIYAEQPLHSPLSLASTNASLSTVAPVASMTLLEQRTASPLTAFAALHTTRTDRPPKAHPVTSVVPDALGAILAHSLGATDSNAGSASSILQRLAMVGK